MSYYEKEEQHFMTGDEYLVERIPNLEIENEELKSQIENLKDNKRIYFVLDWEYTKGKYLVEYDKEEAKLKLIKENQDVK